MSWATPADVVSLTGSPADEVLLGQAQALIEMKIGRTEETATAEMTPRDLEWLRRAVAYQASWMAGSPDLFQRLDVTQLTQDGMQATFRGDGQIYAPLAKKACRQLSWLGSSKSVPIEPFQPDVTFRYPVGGPVIDYEGEPWQPLGYPWGTIKR